MNRKQALKKIVTTSPGLLTLPQLISGGNIPPGAPYEKGNSADSIWNNAIDWKSSALIIVDMQNDFVRSGAPLEVSSAIGTVSAQKALIQAYRKGNLPIVFTKFISRPHYYLLWEWSPQCQPPTKCCWKGHHRFYKDISDKRECTEITDEMLPAPEDIIIEKFGYGAFHGASLENTLHAIGVTSVVITGTVTQICVEETARESFHHGFRTTIVEDGVSSFANDLHNATLKNFAMKFGWVSKSATIISNVTTLKGIIHYGKENTHWHHWLRTYGKKYCCLYFSCRP